MEKPMLVLLLLLFLLPLHIIYVLVLRQTPVVDSRCSDYSKASAILVD